MNDNQTIVSLNDYPRDQYNVLIPVTSMQVMSSVQKVIVNKVKLDTDDPDHSKDIYKEKSSGQYAITAVGGMKLAAAADISIIETRSERPEVCQKCIEMARATGNAQACGACPRAYDVKYSATVRVPEPSGGWRKITATKEIDCSIEQKTMGEAQYKRFLPHRGSIAEKKAIMRAIRSALGLAAGYTLQELKKPFVIAHIVPNLDSPEIKQALISNSLRDMGYLFETPSQTEALPQQAGGEQMALPDSGQGFSESEYQESNEPVTEADYPDADSDTPPWEDSAEDGAIKCADCGREIGWGAKKDGKKYGPEAVRDYSLRIFGRCLCIGCQDKERNARKGGNS